MIVLFICSKIQKLSLLNVPPGFRINLLKRVGFGAVCNVCYSASMKFTDVSKAATLFWTNPMFTAIFAYLLLKEKISKYDIISMACVFIGILVIENPFQKKIKKEGAEVNS